MFLPELDILYFANPNSLVWPVTIVKGAYVF